MNKSYDEELEVLTDKIDRNNIIIASRNYCNLLTMTRALGEVGYNIDVLRVHKRKPSIKSIIRKMKPEALSQYVNHYYECIADNDEEKVLKQLIEIADKNNRRLLIPADDYLAYIIDIYYDDLKEYYILPNINEKAGNIHFLMNKNEQKKLAALYGLPLLNSVVISSYEGVYEIPSGIKYPCFIKPNVTINSTK